MMTTRLLKAVLAFLVLAAPAAAQVRNERGFLTLNGGAQMAAGKSSERFTYQLNAEEATTEARYPSRAVGLFDATAGWRLWKTGGVALGISHATGARTAATDSQVPHPFFDDQPRAVSGEARGLDRRDTAAHLQLYFVRGIGSAWRMRMLAGASYLRVEQDVITAVEVEETYPYDTASFRRVDTARGKGSAPGFTVGIDLARMFSRKLGIGGMVRFTRAKIDLNAEGTRDVSITAGGVQAGVGMRVSF